MDSITIDLTDILNDSKKKNHEKPKNNSYSRSKLFPNKKIKSRYILNGSSGMATLTKQTPLPSLATSNIKSTTETIEISDDESDDNIMKTNSIQPFEINQKNTNANFVCNSENLFYSSKKWLNEVSKICNNKECLKDPSECDCNSTTTNKDTINNTDNKQNELRQNGDSNSNSNSSMNSATRNLLADIADRPIQFPESFSEDFGFVISNVEGSFHMDAVSDVFVEKDETKSSTKSTDNRRMSDVDKASKDKVNESIDVSIEVEKGSLEVTNPISEPSTLKVQNEIEQLAQIQSKLTEKKLLMKSIDNCIPSTSKSQSEPKNSENTLLCSMDPCTSKQATSLESQYSSFTIRTPTDRPSTSGNSSSNIRNILKLQLSTLRTKKNMRGSLKLETKVIENGENEYGGKVLEKPSATKGPKIVLKNIDKNSKPHDVPRESTRVHENHEEKTDDDNVIMEIRKIISKSKIPASKSNWASSKNDSNLEVSSDSLSTTVSQTESGENKESNEKEESNNKIPPLNSTEELLDHDARSNSPFVSNKLDDFLVNAKLNVSYSIPKLYAEEGIKNNYNTQEDSQKLSSVFEKKLKNDVTDADIDEDMFMKPKKESQVYKAKTLAEKRRLLERNKQRENRRISNQKKQEVAQKRSYIIFKNRKIYVKTRSTVAKCLASIDSDLNEDVPVKSRKPSLLTELFKKDVKPIKYKAGPLSKKPLLQCDKSVWVTEIRKLPQILLNVVPELGKPVDPAVRHFLPTLNEVMTERDADFALTALLVQNKKVESEKQVFTFNVPYENDQKQIAVRKKRLDNFHDFINPSKKDTCLTDEEQVADVIQKLITYVEIKELESRLIQEDPDIADVGNDIVEKPEIKNSATNHVLVKRRGCKRRSKIDLELSRLNCKVVSVEIEENQNEEQCFKAHCALGCVCNSLKCESRIELHCRNAGCIFGCVCSKENGNYLNIPKPTIKFPAGTELLSTDTVSRIEDQAKRNLAKVEKEFTQTVIHTSDKTIVIGFGNKSRRAVKAPKKYNDFLDDDRDDDDDDDDEDGDGNNSGKPQINKDESRVTPCDTYATNYDFSDIVPLCLVHSMYDCHCGGYSSDFEENASPKKKFKVDKPVKMNKTPQDVQIKSDKNIKSNESFNEVAYSSSGRVLRRKSLLYADYTTELADDVRINEDKVEDELPCSRVMNFQEQCLKSKKKTQKESRVVFDFLQTVSVGEITQLRTRKNPNQMSECDRFKLILLQDVITTDNADKVLSDDVSESKEQNKRKQELSYRKDEPVKARKLSNKTNRIVPIFEEEIIITDSEWIKKLGYNSRYPLEGYARILPGHALLQGFISRKINVFCVLDVPLKIIINIGQKICSGKIRDVEKNGQEILDTPNTSTSPSLIQQSDNIRKIIKWLLSGTLPARFYKHNLAFLLLETSPNLFEIRGICSPGDANSKVSEVNDGASKEDFEQGIVDQVLEVKHKNALNIIETIFGIKAKFNLRELIEKNDDEMSDNFYMWVNLPEVYQVARWRMIFINDHCYDYVKLKSINYTIRRVDLYKLAKIAKEQKHSLILRNLRIIRSNTHNLFGIYISHTHMDRVFIGPYFIEDPVDDILILKANQSVLYSTQTAKNKSRYSDCNCGFWLYERPKQYKRRKSALINKDTIDLTQDDDDGNNNANDDDDDDDTNLIVEDPAASNDNYLKFKQRRLSQAKVLNSRTATKSMLSNDCNIYQVIKHDGHSIQIKSATPKAPSEFNRFILTNIPHFGYLGAYQADNSLVLEVSWPFEKKVLIFENTDNAVDFLQKRLTQLLQVVPETFKIRVVVLRSLNLEEHKPINYKCLNGYWICGDFGVYNIKEISNEFCLDNLKMSKAAILLLFTKRSDLYVNNKIVDLADLLAMNRNENDEYEVKDVLDKAIEEIKKLKTEDQTIKDTTLDVCKDILRNLNYLSTVLPPSNHLIEDYINNQKKILKNKIKLLLDDDGNQNYVRRRHPSISINFKMLSSLITKPCTSTSASTTAKVDASKPFNVVNMVDDHSSEPEIPTLEEKDPLDITTETTEQQKPLKKLKFIRSPDGQLLLVRDKPE